MDQNKKNPFNAYKKTGVVTASKEKILLMLYESAIRFLKKGIEACDKKDIENSAYWIGRTLDIVNELRSTLNHKIDGDVTQRLEELYGFIIGRLLEGNIQRRSEPLTEALGILNTLYSAWDEAIKSLNKELNTQKP